MSATTTISTLAFASQQVTIYLGIPILIAGVLGGLLNIIVFLSLKTFRQSPCAFYLTVASFVNIGQLLTGFWTRIMSAGFGIDWTLVSLFYCKFRMAFVQICGLTSFTCMCLATVDQFLSTSSRARWLQWSNLKITRRLCVLTFFIWCLHCIPNLIFFNLYRSPVTGKLVCNNPNNAILAAYNRVFYTTFLLGVIPISIMCVFGLLAFRNVRNIAHRTVPLVRHQLDKQLTAMVLLQVIINFFVITPNTILSTITVNTTFTNPVVAAQMQFAFAVTLCFFYSYNAVPFYLYVCASERFRKQLVYVLIDIHLNRWRRYIHQLNNNQVVPYEMRYSGSRGAST